MKVRLIISIILAVLACTLFFYANTKKTNSIFLYIEDDFVYCSNAHIDEHWHCDEEEFKKEATKIVEIKVYNKDAKILEFDFKRKKIKFYDNYEDYILYYDDYVYLYNVQKEKATKLDIDADKYNLYRISREYSDEGNPSAIICYDYNDKASFYNLDKDKMMYEGEYSGIYELGYGFLDAYKVRRDGDKTYYTIYVLKRDEEKVIKRSDEQLALYGYYEIVENNGEYEFIEHFNPWKEPLKKKQMD